MLFVAVAICSAAFEGLADAALVSALLAASYLACTAETSTPSAAFLSMSALRSLRFCCWTERELPTCSALTTLRVTR